MNLDNDDESIFERALRADLPAISEQNRLRQRILAAGVAAGTALGSTSVAAATQASVGASALSKLSALSWPAKLCVAATLAAPVAALPLVYAPVQGAAIVSQVRSSAVSVRARSATKAALSPGNLQLLAAPEAAPVPPPAEREPQPAQARVAARPSVLAAGTLPPSANPNPSPPANGVVAAAEPAAAEPAAAGPAVAAFDSPAHAASASEAELGSASTLAAETQLLDRAFAALAAGDRGTATALVAEHTRRFPNGLLRQERERARSRLAHDPKGE